MNHLPTIFDVINKLMFLKGMPLAFIVFVLLSFLVVVDDWRIRLVALGGLFAFSPVYMSDVYDFRISVVKGFVGICICLILYLSYWQVNKDTQWISSKQASHSSVSILWRFMLMIAVGLLAANLAQTQLSLISKLPQPYLWLIFCLFWGGGLVNVLFFNDWLHRGLSFLLWITALDLYFYDVFSSKAFVALIAGIQITLALALSYVIQMQNRPAHHLTNQTI